MLIISLKLSVTSVYLLLVLEYLVNDVLVDDRKEPFCATTLANRILISHEIELNAVS